MPDVTVGGAGPERHVAYSRICGSSETPSETMLRAHVYSLTPVSLRFIEQMVVCRLIAVST